MSSFLIYKQKPFLALMKQSGVEQQSVSIDAQPNTLSSLLGQL